MQATLEKHSWCWLQPQSFKDDWKDLCGWTAEVEAAAHASVRENKDLRVKEEVPPVVLSTEARPVALTCDVAEGLEVSKEEADLDTLPDSTLSVPETVGELGATANTAADTAHCHRDADALPLHLLLEAGIAACPVATPDVEAVLQAASSGQPMCSGRSVETAETQMEELAVDSARLKTAQLEPALEAGPAPGHGSPPCGQAASSLSSGNQKNLGSPASNSCCVSKASKAPCASPRGSPGHPTGGPAVAASLEDGLRFTSYYLDQVAQMPQSQLPDGFTNGLELLACRMESVAQTDSTSFSGVEAPHTSRRMLHYELEKRLGRRVRPPVLTWAVEWDAWCQKELVKLMDMSMHGDGCVFGDICAFFRDEISGLIAELKKNPALAVETLAPLLEAGTLVKRSAFCVRHQSLSSHDMSGSQKS